MDRLVAYDVASIITELRRVATLAPSGPLTRQAFDQEARVSSSTVVRRFGGWKEALAAAGLADRYGHRPVSRMMRDQRARSATAEEMIAELQRISRKVGRTVITRADLLEHSELMSERALLNRFGSWKVALESADLQLSRMGRRWSEGDYFENLLEVWTHHGRAPTYGEMNLTPSRITNGAYAARFGSWGKAKAAFVERVNSDIALSEGRTSSDSSTPASVLVRPRLEDRRDVSVGVRYQVLKRDRFRCVTCGRSPATDPTCVLHVDHVVAFSRGGKTRPENLRSLCRECNAGKSAGDA